MAKTAPPSPLGLSMMDLISNALSACAILFFILATMKTPTIPPERVLGTLIVKFTVSQNGEDLRNIHTDVYAHAPGKNVPCYYGLAEIENLNKIPQVFGDNDVGWDRVLKNKSPEEQANFKSMLPPSASAVHCASKGETFVIIHDPTLVEDYKWKIGLYYIDHAKYDQNKQPIKIKMEAWLIKDEKEKYTIKDTILNAPTEHCEFEFNPQDYK